MAAWRWRGKNQKQDAERPETKNVVQIILPSAKQGMKDSYAKELRAIGQALEKLQFKSFELRQQDGQYLVSGRASADVEATFTLIRRIRELARRRRGKLSAGKSPVALSYSTTEIENLDSKERVRREQSNKLPDPYSVSQILRGVGAFLDGKFAATLLDITFEEGKATVRFQTADGRVQQEKRDLSYFYDFCVKMYLRREDRPGANRKREPTIYAELDAEPTPHDRSNLLH
jgi:hypothetical protein